MRARRRGAGGKERGTPWKSRGERFAAVADPLAVARAAVDIFREEKPSCESASGTIVARVGAISVSRERGSERERRREGERKIEEEEEGRGMVQEDAQGW